MTTYDFVHLVLHAYDGKIQGRTKLQKTVYFIGALTGWLPKLGYRAYYYGPYSGEVAAAVNELRGIGFLQQAAASAGAVDPHGFEVARYDYSLTPEGRFIAAEKAEEWPDDWRNIQNAVKRLKSVPGTDYVRLSIAAKMYFLLREMGNASLDHLVSLGPEFGWKVTAGQMREAGELLNSMGLIELKQSL